MPITTSGRIAAKDRAAIDHQLMPWLQAADEQAQGHAAAQASHNTMGFQEIAAVAHETAHLLDQGCVIHGSIPDDSSPL